MFGWVRNSVANKCNPIGVDFGSDTLRMAQVMMDGKEPRLVAAASAPIPSNIRHDPQGRFSFFVTAMRDLLAQCKFKGRQVVLALPASNMFIQHLRLAKMDDDALAKAIPWEARGKLPIDPTHALLRHHVAGEVHQEGDPKLEVVLLAAGRELVNQLLYMAGRAKLDVVGMNVEPSSIVDCFNHVYRRKNDLEVVNCYVDIGCSATRVVIARGTHILFARSVPVGGDHMNRAVAGAFGMTLEDARMLRIQLAQQKPVMNERAEARQIAEPVEQIAQPELASASMDASFPLLGAAMAAHDRRETGSAGSIAPAGAASSMDASWNAPIPEPSEAVDPDEPMPRESLVGHDGMHEQLPADPAEQLRAVEQAIRVPLNKLVEELDLCRRYHESTFPDKPVDRLTFVGGEAHHRPLCQHIAQELQLAAQVGDPMVRMARTTEVGIESGLDRRQPQPAWSVAIGLSFGPLRDAG